MKSTPRLTSEMVAEVMVQGRALKTGSFLFKYLLVSDKTANNKAYISFIASKKNFPTAVERNRAKRRGKAALHGIVSKSSVLLPSYSAFLLNKASVEASLGDMALDIEQVLLKSGILVRQ
jgi:ribonuclease P protein component